MTWGGPWGPEADELVRRLEAQGVRLRLNGDRLVVNGPVGVLTEAQLAELRARRLDVIAYLQGDRSRGVRRLESGAVAWLARPPPKERPTTAIME
jgi:hypothetical protein